MKFSEAFKNHSRKVVKTIRKKKSNLMYYIMLLVMKCSKFSKIILEKISTIC